MKRGVLLLFVLLLVSACTHEDNQISYPQILSNDFGRLLIKENTVLRENISSLLETVKYQQEEIAVLEERLEEYHKQNIKKGGPYNWVKQENIEVKDSEIIIRVDNAIIANIADTHSLEPVVQKDSNVIEIIPQSEEDIHLGDIVSYQYENESILHRVISIGVDEDGWYATMKGDNNPIPDPEKVRFDQINRVVVAIIY